MVAKSRAKKLVTASKSASAAGDKMTADAAMSKSKRYSNIAKGMEEQMEEKVTSRDIKMAVGVAKDKRYAGGNMSGAVKTMEKMKPGLSKHPRVQQVLKTTNEDSIQEKITVVHGPAPAGHTNKPTTTGGITSGTVYTNHPAPARRKPEGFGVSINNRPTKIVGRAEFSDAKPGAQSALDQARSRMKKTNEGFDKLSPQQKAHQYNLDSAQKEIDRRHGEGEDMTGAKINKKTYEINKPKKLRVTEGVDFLKVWESIKPVYEEVKTTHEDPLVVTKDEEGHIHTHANLSVANAIHGTSVKHQAIHTGKPVQAGKFTFELSKHHAGALKEDAPFDPVAHKKELDSLMTKHIMAHKALMASPGRELQNKQMERLNGIKAEIRAHKDKVPKGPAPKKDGGPGDYYASKKPGEYTGD